MEQLELFPDREVRGECGEARWELLPFSFRIDEPPKGLTVFDAWVMGLLDLGSPLSKMFTTIE